MSGLLRIGFFAVVGLVVGCGGCCQVDGGGSWRAGVDRLWQGSGEVGSGRVSKVLHVPAGGTVELADVEGPGVIRHMWFTCQAEVPQVYGLLVLRMQWDEEEEPSVLTPLGDFIGVGFGKERKFKSMMTDMDPAGMPNHSALNCYWPMPFAKRARISLENRSNRAVSMFFVHVDYERVEALPPDALYFHASWRRENPVQLRVPYTVLEARGRGCYVGTVMNYHLLQEGSWVEGGDDFYIDGDERPTLPGTGAEDYFGQGWGFRHEENAAWHGTSMGPDDDKMTAYRWHVADPVWFDESLRVVFRCHGWKVGARQDDYSSVAMWYQSEPHAPLPALPAVDNDYLEVADEFREAVSARFSADRLPKPSGRLLTSEVEAVRASGHYDDLSRPEFALDGDLSTKWCDDPGQGLAWLEVDLGQVRKLTGVVVKHAGAAGDTSGFNTAAFCVEVAEKADGPWRRVLEVDNDRDPVDADYGGAVNIDEFEGDVRGRYVRLTVTRACLVDAIARVHEFEVYGE